MLLAIDLGTQCGWATYDRDVKQWDAGVWDLWHKKHEHMGMRHIKLRRCLTDSLWRGIDTVAYEKVMRHRGTAAAHLYGAFEATLQEWCELLAVPCIQVQVATVKKHATGKGNANKSEMIAAANAKWPWLDVVDHNVADALWVCDCALAQLDATSWPVCRGDVDGEAV